MIAVIGAGPAGLACAATLERAGEDVVVLERAEVGAVWASRYDRLQLHTVRRLSGLPGYAIPRAFGRWPARDRVAEYLRLYAERQRLDVRTGIEVERVDRHATGWVVRTSDGDVEAERVVIATGQSNVPFLPEWPGAFDGELIHSAEYRNPATYRGRRVLVVGTGNSGAEIAVDLADGGASEVLLSVRTPPASCAATRPECRANCSASPACTCRPPSSTGSRQASAAWRSRTSSPSASPLPRARIPSSCSGA